MFVDEISFGDSVRIRDTPATRASGHAGRQGMCWGVTTPSATGVDVIGELSDDAALSVHFDAEESADAWFAPDLVEFVDHAVGAQVRIGDSELVRSDTGAWLKSKKRWWRR